MIGKDLKVLASCLSDDAIFDFYDEEGRFSLNGRLYTITDEYLYSFHLNDYPNPDFRVLLCKLSDHEMIKKELIYE